MKRLYILLICAASMFLYSCAKDASWDVNVRTPLFNTSLGPGDLIADSLLLTNLDSSLTFVFDYNLFSITTDTFVSMPDSLYYIHYAIPFGIQAPPGTLVLSKTESKFYDLDGALLTEMRIKSGKLTIRAFNYVGDKAYIEYSLDNSILNGQPVMLQGTIPSYPLTGQHLMQEVDVSGMYLDLRASYMHCNSLKSTLKVYANPEATAPVVINYNDSIDILVEFKDIVIDYSRGYFGKHQVSSGGTEDFEYLEELGITYLDLDNIDMQLTLENHLGVDAVFKLDDLTGHGNTDVALNSEWIGKPILLPRATENPPLSGQVIPSTFTMDFTPANVEAFFENIPLAVSYQLDGTINPMGNVSSGNDFVYYGQGLTGNIHAEIPMKFAINNLLLQDTIAYELERSENYISGSELTLQISNGFPLECSFIMYLLDQNGLVTDSLVPDMIIPSGSVDAAGIVINPTEVSIKIMLDKTQTDHLYEGKQVVLSARMSTGGTPGQQVLFYPHYKIDVLATGLFNIYIE